MTDSTPAVVEAIEKTPFNKKALVAAGAGLVVAGVVVLVVKRKRLNAKLNDLVNDAVSETE